MSNKAAKLLAHHRPLCARYAREARDVYPGRKWHEIEPHVRRAWERTPKDIGWRDAGPCVKSLWARS